MTAALREELRNTLGNLTEEDFKSFKHYLRDQGKIAWGKLEKADINDTVDLMVEMYCMKAGDVMLTILKKMNHNQLAMEKDLEESLREVKRVLRNTLGNLTDADFKTSKHRLRDQDDKIPWGQLEKADRDDTVDLLVQVYSTGAGDVMLTILNKMNLNQLAIDLEKDLGGLDITADSGGMVDASALSGGSPMPQQGRDDTAAEEVKKKKTSLKLKHNQLAMDLEKDLEELGGQQCSPGLVRGDGGVKVDITADSGGMVDAPALSRGSPMLQQGGDDNAAEEVKKKKTLLKLKLREHLKKKFSFVHHESGVSTVQDIYTELHIVEGRTAGVNSTHEVSTINLSQIGRKPSSEDKPVKLANMFTDGSATNVLTMGVAGVGKTVAVQKFVMDWVEEKANQDIDFVFVLPFRELNLKKGERFNLPRLLQTFYPNLEDLENVLGLSKCKILFVLDGLDESRLQLDFGNCICKLEEESSVDMLITSLIKGRLLSSALLWVTTRPAAASQIPEECSYLLTEVRGFNDPQKIEFFQNNIKNPEKAERIIDHIKENRSLHIMCHIPVFCRIIANVLEKILEDHSKKESAKTLTALYTWYTVNQIKIMNDKYLDKDKKMIAKQKGDLLVKLGKLAFKHLEKGNLIFYKNDLEECNIDVDCGALKAGVCTQIFNMESATCGEDMFSFVHLSVQEFLAALYVLENATRGVNCLSQTWWEKTSWRFSYSRFDLFKMAVDKALQSKNGHLDLFVRFLLGLAPMLEPEIQIPLDVVLPQLAIREVSIEKTIQYIKKKIRKDISPERIINLFHCLNELGDNSLVEEIHRYRNSDKEKNLTPAQCSALAYLLLMSAEDLDEFDLNEYLSSDEGLRRMLPVVKVSRRVGLQECNLSKASCKIMASVLQGTPSHLRDLDMSWNPLLKDEGVELLCDGLRDPQCKLEILRLYGCSLTDKSCAALSSAARSTSCSLKHLDLRWNKEIHDAGVQHLTDLLKNPLCKLEILVVGYQTFRRESPAAAAAASASSG